MPWLARRSLTKPTPDWDNRPQVPAGCEALWDAFTTLASARTGSSITIQDIVAWLDAYRIEPIERRTMFFRLLLQLSATLHRLEQANGGD